MAVPAAKVDAMVSAMARMLGASLSIKDPDDDEGEAESWREKDVAARRLRAQRQTIGQLMYEEFRHLPTRPTMDAFDALRDTYMFAEESCTLAAAMLIEAESSGGSDNFLLTPYVAFPPYYQFEEHRRTRGDTLVIGDFGRKLRDDVFEFARDWLLELDRRLSLWNGAPQSPLSSDMSALVTSFADAIAKRHTLMQPPASVVLEVDPLSTRSLEMRADVEFARTTAVAEMRARVDMEALTYLSVVAEHGSKHAEARKVLAVHTAHIRHIVSTPPSELGLVGEHASRMNLESLRKLLKPDMPQQIKHDIADQWASNHGAYARFAIAEAIRRLKGWSPQQHSRFIKVLHQVDTSSDASDPAQDEGLREVPRMPWAASEQRWKILGQPRGPSMRTGLDQHGARVVRFTSAVWQLVAAGAFQQGVVTASIVQAVAVEVQHHASLMRLHIEHEIQQNGCGTKLLETLEHVYDRQSVISDQLASAVCELRDYSIQELHHVFHERSPVFKVVLAPLTSRTRVMMTGSISEKYTQFVADALSVFMPVVEERRKQLAINMADRPNPIGDFLRTVPGLAARVARTQDRVITLDLKDVSSAHPGTRNALEAVARRSQVVRAAHLAKNGKEKRRAVRFWIDRDTVVMLLGM